jgi:hypothetical protein
MSETKRYEGSCHCGKVKYTVTTAIETVIACNCSLCSRAGYLLTFVPAEQVEVREGEDALVDYTFNKHHIHHVFCGTCGVRPFGRATTKEGKAMYAVNVRCLEGVDPNELPVKHVDGRSL